MNQDQSEINKFDQIAHRWWDAESEFKPLHQLNPLRLDWILSQAVVQGKNILDIACGGGLLTEALARKGGVLTGIDLAPSAIQTAQLHALESGLKLNYQISSAEDYADAHPAAFDIVCCMEMLEHVPDPSSIVRACSTLLKSGGWLFLSTINQHWMSYLQAIIGAEYVLGLLPRGTHDWDKFIAPAQLAEWLRDEGVRPSKISGLSYNPLTKKYALSRDTKVNYLIAGQKIKIT